MTWPSACSAWPISRSAQRPTLPLLLPGTLQGDLSEAYDALSAMPARGDAGPLEFDKALLKGLIRHVQWAQVGPAAGRGALKAVALRLGEGGGRKPFSPHVQIIGAHGVHRSGGTCVRQTWPVGGGLPPWLSDTGRWPRSAGHAAVRGAAWRRRRCWAPGL